MKTFVFRRLALINFVVLAIWGVLLRYMQTHGLPGLNYQFLLHGHSHFAFSGWIFLSLAIFLADKVIGEKHSTSFNAVYILTLFCSWGMLITFSLQGYKIVPIIFSTAFILITYWFSFLIFKNSRFKAVIDPVTRKLISGALFFLCLSSLGPFSLAPLSANGFRESPVYQNAIYLYLHFQMNGWMLFGSLALFTVNYLQRPSHVKNINGWLNVFIWSSVPLYFIFTLWSHSGAWLNSVALLGAVLHLISWVKLCRCFKTEFNRFPILFKASLIAITLKAVLQVIVCFPAVGEWVFLNRNLIIGYIHLITLGCVTPLILQQFVHNTNVKSKSRLDLWCGSYVVAVVLYLALLFVQPLFALLDVSVPHFQSCLLWISIAFVITDILFLFKPETKGGV